MASVVDTFVKDYAEKYDFWDRLTIAAKSICEDGVQRKMKLKCNITSRTKSEASIKGSIERRQAKRGAAYDDDKQIIEDLHDLAGVRIILTFPGDVDEVRQFLNSTFDDVQQYFWGLDENGNPIAQTEKEGRFIGYRATHFLVRWNLPANELYKTRDAHVGKRVEIQVTSTAMYAWQQAHHDLVYKQLNGHPSREERALLEMINGLAHAGEMALTQLQILSKRRIEDDTREFADEYEVGVWLKTHLQTLLHFKEPIHAPYLERSGVVQDLLWLFNLNTPSKARQALTSSLIRADYHGIDEHLTDMLFAALRNEREPVPWAETFHNDPTDWAILRICMHRVLANRTWSGLKTDHSRTRLKAFCFINTINFAISEPLRHEFISEMLQQIVSKLKNEQERLSMISSLHALVSQKPDSQESHDHDSFDALVVDMEVLWLSLIEHMEETKSTFLCIALALSLAGIVILPEPEYAKFMDGTSDRILVWPDVPNIINKIKPVVSTLFEGDLQPLKDPKWTRARISLAMIAEGSGWGPPRNDETEAIPVPLTRPSVRKPMTPSAPKRVRKSETPVKKKIENLLEIRRDRQAVPEGSSPNSRHGPATGGQPPRAVTIGMGQINSGRLPDGVRSRPARRHGERVSIHYLSEPSSDSDSGGIIEPSVRRPRRRPVTYDTARRNISLHVPDEGEEVPDASSPSRNSLQDTEESDKELLLYG